LILSQLFLALDIATIVCGAIFGARALLSGPHLRSVQLLALIAFNSICHIVLSRYEYRYWIPAPFQFDVGNWATALNFARNLTPGLFMLLCFTLFADRSRFPRWLLGLFFLQMFLEVPIHWLIPAEWPFGRLATQIAPAFLQTLFVGFALYWTLADWRADLVESRRRSRALATFVIGFNIIGSSLLLRVLIDQNTPANYETHLALVAINLALLLFMLVKVTDEELASALQPARSRVVPAAPPAAVSPEIAGVLARLAALMEVEHAYRRPSLSLRDLADMAGVPEYRLRKVIHEQLGYDNFNAFLHHYRIGEACRQLRDPEMRRIPILTIALSTGYQSVNTFNRGFREIMDMTPSAYRLQDAAPAPPRQKKISPQTA
jgi:AraC-like DNA-binding protein